MIYFQTEEFPSIVKMHYIVGATFSNDNITAWYNGDPYHSMPLALGLVLNTILKKNHYKNHSIVFNNHPLPLTLEAEVCFYEFLQQQNK